MKILWQFFNVKAATRGTWSVGVSEGEDRFLSPGLTQLLQDDPATLTRMAVNWYRTDAYMLGTPAPRIPTDSAITALLGGKAVLKKQPTSAFDWIEAIRAGLPATDIEALLKATHLSQGDLARAVGIPERTLARRKREGVLNSEESAKLLRLARIVGRASEVFESAEAGIDWLKAPNASLGGRTRLSLLDTDIGAESVLDTLGRIEHSVFA